MMKSLFSGVSGLKNHTVRMDVIGNNIANVNTMAYKGNTVTFRDVFYQTRSFASAGDNVSGGTNPRQIGYGLALGSIDKVMTQSGFTFSDSVYDCAIKGEGFFQVMDAAGNIYYTRNGVFNVDNAGNLVDSNGYVVLGISGDPTGMGPGSQRINLFIPDVMNEEASSNRTVLFNGSEYEIRFSASGYGPNGNIALNITHSQVPFATMNGSVLTIQMDLTQNFDYYPLTLDTLPITAGDLTNAITAAGTAITDANTAITAYNNMTPAPASPLTLITPTTIPADATVAQLDEIVRNANAIIAAALPSIAAENSIRAAATPPATALAVPAALVSPATNFRNSNGFEQAVNDAIRVGGVNPGDGVLPLNIDFSSIPSSTQAIPASNFFNFGAAGRLEFTAVVPGIHANAFEVNMRTTDNADAPAVRAQWAQNVLTVTVREGANVTNEMIQDAINAAAGMTRLGSGAWDLESGNQNRRLTVTGAVTPPAGQQLSNVIGDLPRRIGLHSGQDNFYRSIIQSMSTVVMENGRFAGPQTVRDLDLVFIDSGGVIYGEHAVHGRLLLGRIDLAIFQNANGLQQFGTSYYKESLSSGQAEVKIPGDDGAGEVVSGALEMANVDLSEEFSNMIITQRGFQANSRIITVSDTMLEELINLKR
ncbi:MAG: flagellar hook-basal body complex protein [Oscillospiraceae bacterium]|nr:flagellar hook-basal body complex protein [Oscillospiraceae bacterium]